MKQELSASAPTPTVAPPEPPAAPDVAASKPPSPEKRRMQMDQRYVAPLFITCILILANLNFGVLESASRTLLAIGTAIIVEIILGKIYHGKWPNLASSYISGISVGILLRSQEYWPYALCAAISITSKYVLRVNGRHIWNPSNFAIAMMVVLAHNTVATLSVQWDNSVYAMVVIWVLGSIIIARLKRFHITLTYALSFIFFSLIRSAVTGASWQTEISPITGPMYQLFCFFMVTDPKTTVSTKKGQMLVAFLVAAMECLIRLSGDWRSNYFAIHAPYFALFTVGPIANLVEMWMKGRKGGALKPA
jgi:enediyne biosynthesis protein E5